MELLIAAIAGSIISGIAYLAKKKGWEIKTDTLVLIIAVVLGLGYATFQVTLPPEVQEQAVNFASKALSFSWIVWQFLVKRFITKEIAI